MLWCESVAPFGAPVVPEVYWMLIGSSNARLASRSASAGVVDARPFAEQRLPARVEIDDVLERRAAAADAGQDGAVVGRAESPRVQQHTQPGLVDGVLELARLVGGVHVDEDGADAGGRILRDDPLVAVGGPDADAVALRHPAGQEGSRECGRQLPQLGVGGAEVLGADHQGVAIAVPLHGAAQIGPDRLAEQRHARRAVHVGGCTHQTAIIIA